MRCTTLWEQILTLTWAEQNNIITKSMKATIEFNLPEDKYEWENAVQADAMFACLWDVQQELRRLWKYEELSEEQFKMVERIRDSFHSIIQEHNVNLNK